MPRIAVRRTAAYGGHLRLYGDAEFTEDVDSQDTPAMTSYYGPRRSAVQEPEHEPPLQEPVPILPASRPEPLALRPPPLTVTVIAPVPPTLPVIVNASLPAFANRPFEIRIGYR